MTHTIERARRRAARMSEQAPTADCGFVTVGELRELTERIDRLVSRVTDAQQQVGTLVQELREGRQA